MIEPFGPLQGVRVVACSTAQAGTVPYMLMANLGAEVIEIERPELGDDSQKEGLPSRWGRRRPHPSQTRTCRFPASGSSRERFAHDGVAMEDPDGRQGVSGQERVKRAHGTTPPRCRRDSHLRQTRTT
jgi:hypothetical protein